MTDLELDLLQTTVERVGRTDAGKGGTDLPSRVVGKVLDESRRYVLVINNLV